MKIREYREKYGLSQTDLGKMIGVSQGRIYQLEKAQEAGEAIHSDNALDLHTVSRGELSVWEMTQREKPKRGRRPASVSPELAD